MLRFGLGFRRATVRRFPTGAEVGTSARSRSSELKGTSGSSKLIAAGADRNTFAGLCDSTAARHR